MAFGIRILIWGEYASFNRPEMKVERVTYDVITPSAARGILEAIYWKPEIQWVIDRIHVLNPIRFSYVRRNELKGIVPTKGPVAAAMKGGVVEVGMNIEENRLQRAAKVLRNVRYAIEAHLDVTGHDGPEAKPEAKHLDQFRRRAEKGQFFHQPYLGTREFPAFFGLVEEIPSCPGELRGEKRLGLMLHDIEFVDDPEGRIIESNRGRRITASPRFFDAVLRDGVIEVPPLRPSKRLS